MTLSATFILVSILSLDGKLILLSRVPDLRQAENTSILEDIRIWLDGLDSNPALQLKDMLR